MSLKYGYQGYCLGCFLKRKKTHNTLDKTLIAKEQCSIRVSFLYSKSPIANKTCAWVLKDVAMYNFIYLLPYVSKKVCKLCICTGLYICET